MFNLSYKQHNFINWDLYGTCPLFNFKKIWMMSHSDSQMHMLCCSNKCFDWFSISQFQMSVLQIITTSLCLSFMCFPSSSGLLFNIYHFVRVLQSYVDTCQLTWKKHTHDEGLSIETLLSINLSVDKLTCMISCHHSARVWRVSLYFSEKYSHIWWRSYRWCDEKLYSPADLWDNHSLFDTSIKLRTNILWDSLFLKSPLATQKIQYGHQFQIWPPLKAIRL